MNIKDTEYITIKLNGVFVGDKQTSTYRDAYIATLSPVDTLVQLNKNHPNVSEIHCMTSITHGTPNKFGNPLSQHGPIAWFRVKTVDGTVSPWYCAGSSHSNLKTYWAGLCEETCINCINNDNGDFYNLLKKLDGNPKHIKNKMSRFITQKYPNELFVLNLQRVKG